MAFVGVLSASCQETVNKPRHGQLARGLLDIQVFCTEVGLDYRTLALDQKQVAYQSSTALLTDWQANRDLRVNVERPQHSCCGLSFFGIVHRTVLAAHRRKTGGRLYG